MEDRAPRLGHPWLTLFVVVVSAAALAIALPDIVLPWHPFNTYGFESDFDGHIVGVDAGYPAQKAGIVTGDRIDLDATTLADRTAMDQFSTARHAGDRIHLAIRHGNTGRVVTLAAIPRSRSVADNVSDVALMLSGLAIILIGSALLLLRPSMMTFGYYLYSIGGFTGSVTIQEWLPPTAKIVYWSIVAIPPVVGLLGFLIFVFRFPRDEVGGPMRVVERILWPAYLGLAAVNAYAFLAPYLWGRGMQPTFNFIFGCTIATYVAGVVVFVVRYVKSTGPDRQRIKWVLAGFIVGYGGWVTYEGLISSPLMTTQPPIWLINALQVLYVFGPLTVAYAVIKHRVIDVRFAVSRAVVYATLTSILIAAIALIDWLIGKVLAQTQLALAAEIIAAIVIGFWLNGLHAKVDQLIDTVLFRQRHLAEKRLSRVATSLPHAHSAAAVNAMLVEEPADAFELVSAAVFDSLDGETLARRAAVGWPDGCTTELTSDDPLVLQLQGTLEPIRIAEMRWPAVNLPPEAARPSVAVPIVVRHKLTAIALYGPHSSGQDLDPDEIRTLAALATGAGVAFDHLRAKALQERVDELQRQNEELRLQVQLNRA